MKKMGLLILLLSLMTVSLAAKKLAVLPEIIDPVSMAIQGEELYVVDEVTVYVYSLKDYRQLIKFGKEGEGPGELLTNPELPTAMQFIDDQILLNSFNKMIWFSKKGKMIKEIKIPFYVFQIIPSGKNYLVTKYFNQTNGKGQLHVVFLDGNLKEIKKVYNSEVPNDRLKGKITFPLVTPFVRLSGNQIFVADLKTDFIIRRFDLEGKPLTPIEKEYEKIIFTDSFKKESMEWLKIQPAFKSSPEIVQKMIYFPPYLPTIRNLAIKDQKIYVQTYKTRGQLFEFFILDLNGKVLKTVFLPDEKNIRISPTPTPRYDFIDNKFYYLKENADEETWELHVLDI